MLRGKHVKVIIGVDGSCQVDAVNFTDASCLSVTKAITGALGGQIGHERLKPEARARERSGQNERERAR